MESVVLQNLNLKHPAKPQIVSVKHSTFVSKMNINIRPRVLQQIANVQIFDPAGYQMAHIRSVPLMQPAIEFVERYLLNVTAPHRTKLLLLLISFLPLLHFIFLYPIPFNHLPTS